MPDVLPTTPPPMSAGNQFLIQQLIAAAQKNAQPQSTPVAQQIAAPPGAAPAAASGAVPAAGAPPAAKPSFTLGGMTAPSLTAQPAGPSESNSNPAPPPSGFVAKIYAPYKAPDPDTINFQNLFRQAPKTAGETYLSGMSSPAPDDAAGAPAAAHESPLSYKGPSLLRRMLYGLAAGAAGIGHPEITASMVDRFNQQNQERQDQVDTYNRGIPAANEAADDRARQLDLQQKQVQGEIDRGKASENEATRELGARTISNTDGTFQFNNTTGKYDIPVGGPPLTDPKLFTVPGAATPVVGYETKGGIVDGGGKPLAGAVPYAPTPQRAPVAGLVDGHPAFGLWSGKGWEDTNGKPLPNFAPAPSYAETGQFEPVTAFDPKVGTLVQAKFDRRTGTVTSSDGSHDVFPLSGTASSELGKELGDARGADTRLRLMNENARDALAGIKSGHPNQQAEMSLLTNHIGMTLGMQKGARINQAVFDEAQKSAPWLKQTGAKFSSEGYLSGVTLTAEQIQQMTDLAVQRQQAQWQQVKDAFNQYGIPFTPPGAGGAAGGRMVRMRAPNGQEQDVPADQVEHFKKMGAVEAGNG